MGVFVLLDKVNVCVLGGERGEAGGGYELGDGVFDWWVCLSFLTRSMCVCWEGGGARREVDMNWVMGFSTGGCVCLD